MAKEHKYVRYLFMLLFLVMAYLAFLVVKPFISAILASFVIAYIFYPVYKAVNKKITNKNLSAIIVAFFIIILLAVPLGFMANQLTKEARYLYIFSKQRFAQGEVLGVTCESPDGTICEISDAIDTFLSNEQVRLYIQDIVGKTTAFFVNAASEFILSIPMILMGVIIAFLITFFLLRDGKDIADQIRRCLPLKLDHKARIFAKLREVTHAVLYSFIVVSLIKGALGAFGFYIFGISSPLLWGIIMTILAIAPLVGAAMVWIPAALFLIILGYSGNNPLLIWKGIGLILYGIIVIEGMDYLMKMKMITEKTKVHPILVLLGVLGGLKLLGFVGFLIGPLVLVLFIALLEMYSEI